MQYRIRTIVLAISLFALSGISWAAIVDQQTFVTDTVTGLDWLKSVATVNLSFGQVMVDTNTGGTLAGWSYATGSQLNTFIGDATGGAVSLPWNQAYYAPGATYPLISALGATSSGCGSVCNFQLSGLYVSSSADQSPLWASFISQSGGIYDMGGGGVGTNISPSLYEMSFLTRSTVAAVPEPRTYAMLLAGLAGVVAAVRRKKAKKVNFRVENS